MVAVGVVRHGGAEDLRRSLAAAQTSQKWRAINTLSADHDNFVSCPPPAPFLLFSSIAFSTHVVTSINLCRPISLIMSLPSMLRNSIRSIPSLSASRPAVSASRHARFQPRCLTTSAARFNQKPPKDDHYAATTAGEPGESGDHEGQFARTDESITVEYPEERDLPPSTPVQGRGGFHFKRTLATFSLEGRVGVVTGGARGLGLVMAQALVASGADVALVDMNSSYPIQSVTRTLLTRTIL